MLSVAEGSCIRAAGGIGALALLLAVACARVEAAPNCAAADLAVATPTAQCLSEPEAVERWAELSELLEEAAGSSLVRVLLAGDSSTRGICVVRGRGETAWRDRVRLAPLEPALLALPPAPACLAATALEINRIAAREAEVDALVRECGRRGAARRDQDASLGSMPAALRAQALLRDFRRCLDSLQIQRDELWVFDERLGGHTQVFVRSRQEADRRSAIRSCADGDVVIGTSEFRRDVASARITQDLAVCLAAQGWQAFE